MKKLLSIIIVLFAVVFSACNHPEPTPYDNLAPQQQQWAIVYNYTGSWCQYCGKWGVGAMRDAVNVGNTVGLVLKVGSDPQAINTTLLNSFLSDRKYSGVPALFVGNLIKDVQTGAANRCRMDLNQPCTVGIDMAQEIDGNLMKVYVKTKNFVEIPNIKDYYIAVYLLEDGLHYPQNGSSEADPVHNFVLRSTASGNDYFGAQYFTDGALGAEYTGTFVLDLAGYNHDNCYAAVVIYEKNAAGSPAYKYVNCRWTRK